MKKSRLIALFTSVMLIISTLFMSVPAFASTTTGTQTATRLGGANRYEVAANIATTYFKTASTVILVNGADEKLADGLAATPLAKAYNAPILLTAANSIPTETQAALDTIKPSSFIVIGGPASVSDSIVTSLGATRIGGADRYEVATNVAEALKAKLGVTSFSNAVITNGAKFADALAAAPFAAKASEPVLFVTANTNDSATKATIGELGTLGITATDAIGGSASIPDSVVTAVKGTRVNGATREDLSVAIASKYASDPAGVYAVNGYKPADALAIGPLAATTGYPVLYVNSDVKTVKAAVTDYVTATTTIKPENVVAVGGTASVSNAQQSAVVTAATPTELAISSVSAINAKQIKVTFNKAVDRVSAEDVTNYKVTGPEGDKTIGKATYLDDSNVMLTLSFSPSDIALNNGSTYTVKALKTLKDASKNTLTADLSSTVTFSDTTMPTVTDVKTLGLKTVEVTFSEPVKNAATSSFGIYALDKDNVPTGSNLVTGGSISSYNDNSRVLINLPGNLVAGTSYRLLLNADQSITDYVGYKVPSTKQDFEYSADTTVPSATDASVISQKYVLVTFNKPVNPTASEFYWNTDGQEGNSSNQATDITAIDAQTYKVEFGNLITDGQVYLFAKGVQDYAGNTAPTAKFTLTVNADITPAVSKAELTSKRQIKVTFNEDIQPANTTVDNFILKDKDGNMISRNPSLDYAVKSDGITDDNSTRLINLYTDLGDGSYTLTVTGVKDSLNRTLPDFTATLTVSGVTSLGNKSAIYYQDPSIDNDIAVVSFDNALNVTGTDSALDLSKWQVTTTVGTKVLSDISGASVSALSDGTNKAFKIMLPEGTLPTSGATLYLSNVSDANGKMISPATIGLSLKAIGYFDLSKLSLIDSCKATDSRTIQLTVKTLLSNIEKDDFIVKDNGTAVTVNNVTYTNSYDDTKATITFTLANDITSADTYTIVSSNDGINTKDVFGNTLATSKAVVVSNQIQNYADKAYITDHNVITVLYKNAATTNTTVKNDFTVKDSKGNAIAVASVAPIANGLTITTSDDLPLTDNVTVSIADGLSRVNGLSLKAGTVTTSNFGVTDLSLGSGTASGVYGDGETVEITFSNSIDPLSVKAGWDGTALTGLTATFTKATNTLDLIDASGVSVGKLQFTSSAITELANTTVTGVKYELSANNKIKVTLGTIADGTITNDPGSIVTFIPSNTLKSVDGTMINVSRTIDKTESDIFAAKSISITPTGALDNNVVVSNNYAASAFDETNVFVSTSSTDFTTAGNLIKTTDTATFKGLKLDPTVNADGTITFTLSGTTTSAVAATDKVYVEVKDGANATSNVLTVALPVIANGTTISTQTVSIKY